MGVADRYSELPERADCDSLVSNECYWREFSRYAGATAKLDERQRWFVGGGGGDRRGSKRENGNDGLWRWMPGIAVDQNGNMAIGYSTSSATQEPSIRYAGRLASDPLNNL